MTPLTVTQAADRLGVTPQRVRAMIGSGLITATRHGPVWLVDAASVEERRKSNPGPGQPRKKK